VVLQTAVLDLYTHCQLDSKFATSKVDAGGRIDVQDPLTMLRMIQARQGPPLVHGAGGQASAPYHVCFRQFVIAA
jgi:hypothetical protein